MKKLMTLLVAMLLVPVAFAVDTGTGIGLEITPEEFAPLIWMCDNRMVLEDSVEEGRKTESGETIKERTQNYAFEGEQIKWEVLVMDKNKIEQVQDVVATIGGVQGTGNDVEVECGRVDDPDETIPATCEARILEESLTGTPFDPDTQAFYECVLTVETQDSMFGEHFVTVEVISVDGEATMDENEYWFLNPNIGISIDGGLTFDDVRPGTVSYSDTLVVTNDADDGSGVLLDMFISGTDFYDPASSGAKCPTSNRLKLSNSERAEADIESGGAGDESDGTAGQNTQSGGHQGLICGAGKTNQAFNNGLRDDNADHLCYFATNGAYDTFAAPNSDEEGYVPIVYGDQFTRNFYNDAEVIRNAPEKGGLLVINGIPYHAGNVLAPGADIAVTFKLGLPEPCVGDFSDGDIYFWGEAI